MRLFWIGPVVLGLIACEQSTTPTTTEPNEICNPTASTAERVLPLFVRPFEGPADLGNYFDHDLPFQFEDSNGYQLTTCGARAEGIDGHNGYDWRMPEGTRLFAAGDGVVERAGRESDFFCPLLGRRVAGMVIVIRHEAPGGEMFLSGYSHLSVVHVSVGQRVQAGEHIGHSGNTGCSTAPHLHFSVFRDQAGGVRIDPYGWHGSGLDPWAEHPEGAESVWLWRPGEAPELR